MTTSLTPEYLAGLERALSPTLMRGVRTETGAILAGDFLPRSQTTGETLSAALDQAETPAERSQVEVQLLAAAAADLAVADKLASGPDTGAALRSEITYEPLIWQGLTNPEALLQSVLQPPRYRGADHELLAVVYQVLNSIQENTIETTADAITAALTMNAAILRDALRLAGMDIQALLEDVGADKIGALVIEAWQKMRFLIGVDNVALVQETVGESIEKLREKIAVSHYVKQFLATDAIYADGRELLQYYQGPESRLTGLAPAILALEGSFSGRNKMVGTLVRLLSLAKLTTPLRTPPWGPLIAVSSYLLLIGYELYSAHDHVDSDRYPFFDRVAGVRTQLATLNWPH